MRVEKWTGKDRIDMIADEKQRMMTSRYI
jgi:hypothetical protein